MLGWLVSTTQVRAGANCNIVCDAQEPPRTAMDFAAAVRRGDIIDTVRRGGGKGLCKKGPKGGFVAKDKGKGKGKAT